MVSELAMFPLGTVVLPYSLLPLHVFEPRYRALVQAALADNSEFGTVLIERGSEVGGGDVRFGIGTRVRLVHCEQFPDGRYAIAVAGVGRLRIVEWLADDPFPRARVESIDERVGHGDVTRARRVVEARVAAVHECWARLDPRFDATRWSPLDVDPVIASYELCARGGLDGLDALRVLEAPDVGTRLELLAELLADQLVLLRARLDGEG